MTSKSNLVTGNSKQTESRPTDLLKWLLVTTIWISGIVGSYFLHNSLIEPVAMYQWGLWIVVVGVSGYLAFTTLPGMQLWQFLKDAQIELKKVVWPNRQETLQATLMVLVAVIVSSLLLWLIDALLFYLINMITNFNS